MKVKANDYYKRECGAGLREVGMYHSIESTIVFNKEVNRFVFNDSTQELICANCNRYVEIEINA